MKRSRHLLGHVLEGRALRVATAVALMVSAVSLVVIAVAQVRLLDEERRQTGLLSQQNGCIRILIENQSKPKGSPVLHCPMP